MPASALPAHTPDLANGEYMFTAGGCAECHAVPLAKCDEQRPRTRHVLAGGRCLKTPFGAFHVPNISPDKETGIGNWTHARFRQCDEARRRARTARISIRRSPTRPIST